MVFIKSRDTEQKRAMCHFDEKDDWELKKAG